MKTLNRTQLKLIAICAMVCDHVAWGFVDFMSPLGQVMHIIGRFTLPIMCFFIAEGFRHTSSVKGYMKRMALFSVVAMLPFYLFFHDVYEYRQNIIFDQLLGLLLLAALENKQLKKWQKVIVAAALFAVSIAIGGWIIMPMLYILVFYYGKDFKTQAAWFCGLTVTLEVFLIVAVELNRIWHFSHYDWPWYEKLYLLGFMLPLLVLKRYNGEKGKDIGKYFFYLFYPAHFLVLAGIRVLLDGVSLYDLYVAFHVFALIVCIAILFLVLWAKPSRGQSATLLLVLAGCIYCFGFLIEIIAGNTGGFYIATLTQYFGECLVVVGFTIFVAEMCHREIPAVIYGLECLCGIIIMWMLFTTRENHIFYTYIGVNEEGPFPRLELTYGWGFTAFTIYMAIAWSGCMVMCLLGAVRSRGVDRKRIICTAVAMVCPWIPNFIRSTGITGGYEVSGLGFMGATILVGMALIKYGYFDSIALAGENALSHGQEGIMVINNHHSITYFNKRMEEVFGGLHLKQDAYRNETLADIFEGRLKTFTIREQVYEMRVEPLNEGGYIQGYMLWMFDITEHHKMLTKISDMAHKDALTGLFNRNYFIEQLEEYMAQDGGGSLFMMDLNHFKQVNDRFGHQAGDECLVKLGEVLSALTEDVLCSRLGGDEFCMFYKGVIDAKELEHFAEEIAEAFQKKIEGEKYNGITGISFGIARILEKTDRKFEKLYADADKAMYVAKNKKQNCIYIL